MVEKIKDAANLLKAKITKDQLEQTLVQITSEENWQASTHLLHEIANAAYNYEKWQKINEFIWDKLKKSKSWRKILKSLALVQFLLKNGPSSVVSCYKYDIYQFRTFDSYTLFSEGTDRGQPIREKSKSIVQLLSNEELLQDERVKAKTIRQRMSGVLGSGIKYNSYTGNNSYDTYETQNKYGQQNQSWGKNGYYGNYQPDKPTIDKYKNKSTTITKVTGNNSTGENQVKTDQNDDKKPFQRLAPKLSKPGDKKPKQQIQKQEKIETKNTNINIFEDVTQNTAHLQTNEQYKQQEKLIQQEKEKLHKQQEQFLFKQQQQQQQIKQQQEQIKQQQILMEQQKMQQMQQSLQGGMTNNTNLMSQSNQGGVNTGQQYNLMNAQNYSIGPNNAQMNQYNGQNYNNAQNLYLGTQQQQMNFQTNPPQQTNLIVDQTGSFMQNNIRINPMYPTTIPMASQHTQQASLSLQTKKQDEQFGGFQSAQTQNAQNVQWLSKEQKGLIDFSDFGAQIKQSNQPQVKKKNKGNGNGISVDVWNW